MFNAQTAKSVVRVEKDLMSDTVERERRQRRRE